MHGDLNNAIKARTTFTILTLLLHAVALPVYAATITVTNTNDSGPGALRQALLDANDGDTIDFAVTGTIALTGGELVVDKSVTISGPGANNLAINENAGFHSRIFNIRPGRNVSISGLKIMYGDVAISSGNGGGILNDHAVLGLVDCTVDSNAAANGGGIYNDGRNGNAALTVVNTIVTGNIATFVNPAFGGGIFNNAQNGSAALTIINSTVSSNSAIGTDIAPEFFGIGGGIYNHDGTLTISSSTISDNQAGGGFHAATGYGGGIYNDGTGNGTIGNSTISYNIASAGIGNDGGGGGISNLGMLMIESSILSDNVAQNAANLAGAAISHGYNVCSDLCAGYFNGPGDHVNTEPLLGPLQDNGGATLTRSLLPGSPAVDAGNPNFIPPPWYDQRGRDFWRVRNGRIDIGSFEVQAGSAIKPTPTPRLRPTPAPRPTPQ